MNGTDTEARNLIQFHLDRLGVPVTLDETHPSGDRAAERFLSGLWSLAEIGAEMREGGQAVREETAAAVAHALFVLNFGGEHFVAALAAASARSGQ